jgi:hypothetical protein
MGDSMMRHHSVATYRQLVTVSVLCVACNADGIPSGSSDPENPPPVLSALLVSNPVVTGADGFSTQEVERVYVSMRPEAIQDGDHIEITNPRSGALVSADLVSGGLDPSPMDARAGDTLQIIISGGTLSTARRHSAMVPDRQSPRIVRTSPTKGKKDAALGGPLLVVLSEPVNPSSVSTGTMRLMRNDGGLVSGTVTRSTDGLALAFAPSEPFVSGTDYVLRLRSFLTDLDGDALQGDTLIDFRTAGVAPLPTVPVPDPPPGPGSGPGPGPGPTPDPGPAGTTTFTLTVTGTNPDPSIRLVVCRVEQWDCYGTIHNALVQAGVPTQITVPAGTVYYWLEDLAVNCVDPTPNQVEAQANQDVAVSVVVACLAAATIEVVATVSGPNRPTYLPFFLDGWWHWWEAGQLLTIDTFEGLRRVELRNMEPNCQPVGDAAQSVTLQPGETRRVHFTVECVPLPTLNITVQASGANIPDFFRVGINPDWDFPSGYEATELVAPNGVFTIQMYPGQHSIWLVNLPSHCSQAGANPIVANGTVNTVTQVNFVVVCQ